MSETSSNTRIENCTFNIEPVATEAFAEYIEAVNYHTLTLHRLARVFSASNVAGITIQNEKVEDSDD